MNFKDHHPPHFHVWYGDFKAIVTIDDGIVKGEMPQRALKMFTWSPRKIKVPKAWANAYPDSEYKVISKDNFLEFLI